MKYLLLLLLSFNIFADHFIVKIKPDNPKHGELSIDAESQEDAKQKLVKWIERQKVYKGAWSLNQDGAIAQRVIQDLEGNETTQYFKPSNFSVEIQDHTEEENEKKAKEAERQALKDKLKDNDLSLTELNKLMRDFYAL